jgi:glutamine amidotransferase
MTKTITVFDYGAGNLYSIANAIERVTTDRVVHVTDDVDELVKAAVMVLPGVGAFDQAASRLSGNRDSIREAVADGAAVLGICLGMQLLFDRSDEGTEAGLGLLSGEVVVLDATVVPHMGWNSIDATNPGTLEVPREAYFAHSYWCRPNDNDVVVATTELDGNAFPSIVRKGRVVGTQFHPEKSDTAGLAFLRSFLIEATS